MMTKSRGIHATRDGREIPPGEMSTKHLWAARGALLKWLKVEHDSQLRRDLKANLNLILDEIGRRTGGGIPGKVAVDGLLLTQAVVFVGSRPQNREPTSQR